MQGREMAAYQRASIRLWKREWDPVRVTNVQWKVDQHGRTQFLWKIQAKMATGEQCIPIFINYCDRYLFSAIVSQTVWRLSVYGPIILPDHRAGPEQQLLTKLKFTSPSP